MTSRLLSDRRPRVDQGARARRLRRRPRKPRRRRKPRRPKAAPSRNPSRPLLPSPRGKMQSWRKLPRTWKCSSLPISGRQRRKPGLPRRRRSLRCRSPLSILPRRCRPESPRKSNPLRMNLPRKSFPAESSLPKISRPEPATTSGASCESTSTGSRTGLTRPRQVPPAPRAPPVRLISLTIWRNCPIISRSEKSSQFHDSAERLAMESPEGAAGREQGPAASNRGTLPPGGSAQKGAAHQTSGRRYVLLSQGPCGVAPGQGGRQRNEGAHRVPRGPHEESRIEYEG